MGWWRRLYAAITMTSVIVQHYWSFSDSTHRLAFDWHLSLLVWDWPKTSCWYLVTTLVSFKCCYVRNQPSLIHLARSRCNSHLNSPITLWKGCYILSFGTAGGSGQSPLIVRLGAYESWLRMNWPKSGPNSCPFCHASEKEMCSCLRQEVWLFETHSWSMLAGGQRNGLADFLVASG